MGSLLITFPVWSVAPFIILLLSIAVVPIVFSSWWDRNANKLLVSIGVSLPVLMLLGYLGKMDLLKAPLDDYVSFMVLLGALFVISGGIHIKGEFSGTPHSNTAFLAVGAVLANLIGTTGASMLLIRPYLRANQRRERRSHLPVFFIFIVSNIGGLLTPLGDPPLYLGFLEGVPFFWTLDLWPIWLTTVGAVLIVFNVYDRRVFVREDLETPGSLAKDVRPRRRLSIDGKHNFLCLGGVIGAVLLSGHYRDLDWIHHYRIQDLLILLMAVISWFTTPRAVHKANHFHFRPIAEVAAVFVGVFITMIPALELLRTRSSEIGITEPWQYFWMSGALSSFLDNAPTYMAFAWMALGHVNHVATNFAELLNSPQGPSLLRAVSVGAVFMGANSYIGNGPNFMVKSIAELHGIRMPSFGGYMVFSGVTLIPIFVLVTLIFFR